MRGGVNVAVWMVLVFCSGLSMAAEPSDLVKAGMCDWVCC